MKLDNSLALAFVSKLIRPFAVKFQLFSSVGFLIGAFTVVSLGQAGNMQHAKDRVDQTLRSNARINPSTLAVELSIPISDVPGRGGAGMPLVFNYSSKVWELEATGATFGPPNYPVEARPVYSSRGRAGWTSSYSIVALDSATELYDCHGNATDFLAEVSEGCSQINYYAKKIRVYLPGGTTHELRKDNGVHPTTTGEGDRTGVYYAVDGSRVRLEWGAGNTSTLFLPDGGRYLFDAQERGYRYIDRHGNKLEYNQTTKAWTDTLGRTLGDPLAAAATPTEGVQTFSVPGLGTATRAYQLVWKKLSSGAMASGYTLAYETGNCNNPNDPRSPRLFDNTHAFKACSGGDYFDPIVLTEIVLPNNQKYQFAYNQYGEIVRIDYPTGGYERFVYGQVRGLSWDYAGNNFVAESYAQSNRGVYHHYVGASDGAAERHWQYSPVGGQPSYLITTTNPDNTVEKRFLHPARSRPIGSTTGNYGFETALIGMERETQMLDSTGVMRVRKLFEWEATAEANPNTEAERDARLKRQITISFEPNSTDALATMTETVYETPGQNGAPTDEGYFAALNARQVKSYKYKVLDGATAQTGSLATIAALFTASDVQSIAETDYLYNAAYKARGMVGLVTEQRVMNPASPTQAVAKTQIAYDEAAYPILSYGITGTASWEDPGANTKRGLVTTTKTWDSSASGGAGNWIVSSVQYDQFGNARKTWSPNYQGQGAGNVTEIQYNDCYSDSVNRSTYAFPTKTISATPSDGVHGSNQPFESTITYDFSTGLPTSSTDANGVETRTEYNDALLRPTKVANYVLGQQVGGSVETVYGVPNSSGQLPATERFVKTKAQIDVDKWTEGFTWFDGLGRTVKSQQKDSAGDVFAFTCYDLMGRPVKASNPRRGDVTNPCASGTTGVEWTESFYDDLSRVVKVKTPDGAEVITTYGLATTGSHIGTSVTVKDQALKERRSITNALGQLTRVDEPNDAGQLGSIGTPNQPTVYTYDALSNLTSVTQSGNSTAQCGGSVSTCTQTRTFAYNSLSRLLSAQNPESGTIQYSYDASGNLSTKTAHRTVSLSIKTIYSYDALNRVKTRLYQKGDGTALPAEYATPAVSYFYDGKGLAAVPAYSKGKLTKVSSSVSETRYTAFDALGRVTANEQVTDGQSYPFTYQYNLSGALTEEKYPSGRTVRNNFDADGDLAAVSSRARSAAPMKPYANNFTYTAHGAVSAMQFGNGRWETTQFNSRLQPVQLGLGTTNSATNPDLWKVNFTYGGANNNGNIISQTIVVPSITVDGTTYNGFTAAQNYSYDSLNRLEQAVEIVGGNQTWRQTYTFDRFGNRKFNLSQTTAPVVGTGSEPKVINPEIDPNTNRLKQTQYGEADVYLFDAAGNMTKDASGKQFLYDGENKQKEVKNISSQSLGTYFYDGDGKRVKKVTQSETTIFVYSASGKLAAEYSTLPPVPPAQATTSYLTNDHLGSPRVVTNHAGTVTSRRDFLPFGEEIGAAPMPQTAGRSTHPQYTSDNVRQKFTTYERDAESGLDYAQARYYNKQHGRFTSVDPENAGAIQEDPQTWNAYSYTRNSPLVFTDSTGLGIEVCYTGGSSCTTYDTLKDFNKYKNALAELGHYIKNNTVFDSEGNKIATLRNTDFDHNPLAQGVANELNRRNPLFQQMGEVMLDVMTAPLPGPGKLNTLGKIGNGIRRSLSVLNKVCFVAGTSILTKDGLKPIEKIKVGDEVASYDEQTKQVEYKTVVQTFERFAEAGQLLSVRVEGETNPLGVTNEHPFYVRVHQAKDSTASGGDEGEWVEAGKLETGDEIKLALGGWAKVLSVKPQFESARVYNFEVADNHNYFVGQTNLLVHNNCKFTFVALEEGFSLVKTQTAKGEITILSQIVKEGDKIILKGLEIEGPGAGSLGRQGLKQLVKEFGKQLGAKEVVVEGAKRSTGMGVGHVPMTMTFKIN